MKKLFFPLIALVVVLTMAFALPTLTDWKIDSKYTVKFIAGEYKGFIKGLKGTLKFDENAADASVFNITFDVNTIDLGDAESTNHAKEKDWLDAATYQTIRFKSSAIIAKAKGYEAKGMLSIKGVDEEIVFPFTFNKQTKTGTFKGSFKIAPKDYGISEEGIGNGIKIDFVIPVKQ